jgi:hypothetical protein
VSLLDQVFLSHKKDRGVHLLNQGVLSFGGGFGRSEGSRECPHVFVGVVVPGDACKVLGLGVAEDGHRFAFNVDHALL